MHHQDRHCRLLLAGLALSALAHLGAGLALVGVRLDTPPSGADHALVSEPEPPVRLGIERSRAVTMNWLGFETPTEHAAREATVEQSAMALRPPPPAPTAEGVESEAQDSEASQASAAAIAANTRLVEAILRAVESARSLALSSAASASGERETQTAPAPPAEVAQPMPAAPAAPQPAPRQADATPIDERAPIVTTRESIATALRTAPTVVPGKVLAAHGMEIQTRRPQWTRLTLMTRRPANPVVQISFGRDGRVRRAGFLSDGEHVFSTGFDDVDEPLLNAVFRWTASGAALERLPEDAPDAVVTILVRVILIG